MTDISFCRLNLLDNGAKVKLSDSVIVVSRIGCIKKIIISEAVFQLNALFYYFVICTLFLDCNRKGRQKFYFDKRCTGFECDRLLMYLEPNAPQSAYMGANIIVLIDFV